MYQTQSFEVCVSVCVHACVRACMRVNLFLRGFSLFLHNLLVDRRLLAEDIPLFLVVAVVSQEEIRHLLRFGFLLSS